MFRRQWLFWPQTRLFDDAIFLVLEPFPDDHPASGVEAWKPETRKVSSSGELQSKSMDSAFLRYAGKVLLVSRQPRLGREAPLLQARREIPEETALDAVGPHQAATDAK